MIRRRLVAAIALVAAAAITLGGYSILVLLEDRLIDNVDRDLRSGTLAGDVRAALTRGGGRSRDGFDPRARVALVRVDADGTVTASAPSGLPRDPDPLPDIGAIDDVHRLETVRAIDGDLRYRAVRIPAPNGESVIVAASLVQVDETLKDARRVLLVVGIGAVGVIGSLSWWVIRRGLAPLERMIGTADSIADGDLGSRTAVPDDGSEVGRLGHALDTMLDRIQASVEARDASDARLRRFVADASHELRTPLSSVQGYAELYRHGATDPEEIAEGMRRIEAEAARMSSLVGDLLTLARLDEGHTQARRRVDLSDVVAAAVDAVRVIDPTRTWDLTLPPEPVEASVDPGQIRQVIDNLLTNARIHTPPGTTVDVSVAAGAADRDDGAAQGTMGHESVVVRVCDDGPGVPPAERERIFDRFWQGRRADEGAGAGTGLGLSIVREIVEAHAGIVAVTGGPEGGACFLVELPAAGSART